MRRVRYTRSDGLNIAYEVVSDGPPDIVVVDGFVSHRDLDWEWSFQRRVNELVTAMGRVIFFDKRGVGLSDRELGQGTLEDRMDDIRAVMDAVGSERASLICISEGGALGMMFAATYPDRVDHLVLYGCTSCYRRHPDYRWGLTDEDGRETVEAIERHWGSGRVLATMIGLELDEHTLEVLGRYERSAASPAMARRIAEADLDIDARPMLTSIGVPTLVVHHADDPHLRVEGARWMAAQIPGARFLEIPGQHGVHLSDDAGLWDAIHEFITGEQRRTDIDRVLATVLFTDIVRSTRRAAELGDAEWRSRLDHHDAIVERCVERHRGRVVKSTGDGAFAVFDGPARGIRCAQAIIDEVQPLGLQVRAGLHTGECEVRGDDYAGMTVHIGARISALAEASEVKVSSTVRDLVIGADLEFTDQRTVELEGVPGQWTILTVA
jgi:class 3 adenylate cyclase